MFTFQVLLRSFFKNETIPNKYSLYRRNIYIEMYILPLFFFLLGLCMFHQLKALTLELHLSMS